MKAKVDEALAKMQDDAREASANVKEVTTTLRAAERESRDASKTGALRAPIIGSFLLYKNNSKKSTTKKSNKKNIKKHINKKTINSRHVVLTFSCLCVSDHPTLAPPAALTGQGCQSACVTHCPSEHNVSNEPYSCRPPLRVEGTSEARALCRR